MALSERTPVQPSEHPQTPDAGSIASHVASVVENLQKDQQTINNPFELCRRADMAMVATLQIVESVLPDSVREQVQSLISIHDAVYQAALPSTDQPGQEHEH